MRKQAFSTEAEWEFDTTSIVEHRTGQPIGFSEWSSLG